MSKEIIQDRSNDLTGVGGIKFNEGDHTYHNAKGDRYTGITTLLGNYHMHFDSEATSLNKAIKDCVIQYFGKQKYDDKMNSSNGASVIKEIYDKMPSWLLDPIRCESIKTVVTDELGEENYLKLEKQARGKDKLVNRLPVFKEKKPELYEKINEHCIKSGVITQFGLENYKALTKKYDGFDNILKAAPGIEKKYPVLYEDIKVKRQWLKDDWIATNLRATTEGTIEHDKREQEIYDNGGYEWNGTWYSYVEGKNISNVTLDDVIVIPECMVWNHEMRLGGLADIFLFNKGVIYVLDYKTNATIDIKPKIANKKYHTMMTGVCSELHDLNYYHYSLQLKIYQLMAIMIRPDFSAGDNIIIHTTSDTHYRYEDKHYECFDVEHIVPKIFEDVKKKLK